jgi:hypothetical protein
MSDLYGVALGGFLGIIGGVTGQMLQSRFTARRERKQWIADSRKEEYRELLKTLTQTATFLMEYKGTRSGMDQEYQKRFREIYGNGLRVIADRIFIAEEIKEAKIYDRWTAALVELDKSSDIHPFDEAFDRISADIVKLALKD